MKPIKCKLTNSEYLVKKYAKSIRKMLKNEGNKVSAKAIAMT